MTVSPFGRHLILARHGRTALNAEGRLRGLTDPPLDEAGLAQARALAGALAPFAPVRVFCSPLTRARQTAQALGDELGVPVVVDQRFLDRDYGPHTGEVRAEVIARWGSVDAAPGVEPVDDVLARARPALDALLAEVPEGNLVVVSHDAVIRPLIATIDSARVGAETPTGSWNDLLHTAQGWSVLAVDQLPGG